jgi:hypothetical protein
MRPGSPGIGGLAIASAALISICARVALASECSGDVSPCINDDTLWPHAGPSHFLAVGGSETTGPAQLGLALQTSYLSRPIVLKLTSPGGGSQANVINDQANGTFLWSYGIGRRLELDLALPLTFGQGGTGLAPVSGRPGLKDTAVRDMRFGFTYALVRKARAPQPAEEHVWGLAGRFEVSAPTGDSDQFAGERSGVFVPSLAADGKLGRFFGAAEAGARIRPITELLGARVGTQLLGAIGVGYDVVADERLSAALEAWALPTLATQSASSSRGAALIPAEWQLSLRTSPLASRELSVQVGGGGALDNSLTAPQVRFTLSIRWTPSAHPAAVLIATPP